jgi:hypothetical protein
MHPGIAKTLVEQRREELVRHTAQSRRDRTGSQGPSWLSRHLPRWQVSWSRTVLSPAGEPGPAASSHSGRPGRDESSLVIIISAHRSA